MIYLEMQTLWLQLHPCYLNILLRWSFSGKKTILSKNEKQVKHLMQEFFVALLEITTQRKRARL